MEHSVFISYARTDATTAAALDQWLRDTGVRVLIDDRDFIPGNHIDQEIARCIKQSGVVVCIYSEASANRHYPLLERRIASLPAAGSRLIYFCIDDTELPLEAQPKLAIKAAAMSFDEAMRRLWAGISEQGLKPERIDLAQYAEAPPWGASRADRSPAVPETLQISIDNHGRASKKEISHALQAIRRQVALESAVPRLQFRQHESLALLRTNVVESYATTGQGEVQRCLDAVAASQTQLEEAVPLLITRMLPRWSDEDSIIEAVDWLVRLAWICMVGDLARYQLDNRGLPMFEEYLRVRTTAQAVAKAADVDVKDLLEYEFYTDGEDARRIYVPLDEPGKPGRGLDLYEATFRFRNQVSLPMYFMSRYLIPQTVIANMKNPQAWDFKWNYRSIDAHGYRPGSDPPCFDVDLTREIMRRLTGASR